MPNTEKKSRLEDWFEVAKTGTFPQGDLTESLFDEVVSSFSPDLHEPPVTLGHIRPETHNDKPAAGWIAGLKRVGDTLFAKAKQVAAEFDAAVQEGRFKKRSIGLRLNEAGKYYLHHLAFLGAMPPAVKGLSNVYQAAYSNENTETEKTFEFTYHERVKKMEFTESELKARDEKIAAEAKAAAKKEFDEALPAAVEAAVAPAVEAAKKEVVAEVEAKAEETKAAEVYSADVEAFLKEYSEADRLSPAQVAILRPFLAAMNPKTEIEFSEKDAEGKDAVVKRNALKVVRDLFANATVIKGDFADTKKGFKGGDYAEEKAEAEKLMKADNTLSLSAALLKARSAMKKN